MTLSRAQLLFIAIGCSLGLVFAVIGAATAVIASQPATETVEKGDRIAAPVLTTSPSVTIEEVNLDIGISNLIRIEEHIVRQ
jgi:hypothetical protein